MFWKLREKSISKKEEQSLCKILLKGQVKERLRTDSLDGLAMWRSWSGWGGKGLISKDSRRTGGKELDSVS